MISAVLAAVVLLGSAGGTVDKWAPWAKASDLQQIAGDLYPMAITQINQQIIYVQEKLRAARKNNDPETVRFLLSHIEDLKQNREKLIDNQTEALKK